MNAPKLKINCYNGLSKIETADREQQKAQGYTVREPHVKNGE